MTLRNFYARVRCLFHWNRKEQELDEEIRFHLSEEAEERRNAGLPAGQAHLSAARDFGNVGLIREATREVWGWASVERLVQDVRYALRSMRRQPAFSTAVILTLALGTGANAAMFSLVSGILLRPLPYAEPDRLVSVTGTYPRGAFVELRSRAQTMRVAAYAEGHDLNLSGIGEPTRLTSTLVSDELLSLLDVRPALGRTFQPGEDLAGRDRVVILSHAVWAQHFSGDPTIIGRAITLDGTSREVVGIMPAAFRFPSPRTQAWIPLHVDSRTPATFWAGDFMPVIARLHPGVSIEQARDEIRRFQAHVPTLFPWAMPASWNADVSVVPLVDDLVADVRARLLLLLGVVGLVLVIACANIANLTLARAASRAKEIGVRCALGASRLRIVRQLLTESLVLALAGGSLGLLIALQTLDPLKRLLPAGTPRLADVDIDWRVLAFTAALAAITGLACGASPALHASRAPVTYSLRTGGRDSDTPVSRRLRSALVIGETGFAVLLVIAAALLVRSYWALSQVNTGFEPQRVVTARITPNETFCANQPRCLAFYRQLLDEVRSSPGVDAAALVNTLPLDGRVAKRSLNLAGRSGGPLEAAPLFWLNVVTPEYFRVMGIRLLSGRAFTDADLAGHPPVAIVPGATAQRFWPDGGAVGRQLRFVGESHWHTVVGVVGDVRAHDLRRDVPDWIAGTVYVPYSPKATLEHGQLPSEMTIALASTAATSHLGATLRSTVGRLSPEIPISDVQPLRSTVSNAAALPGSVTLLFVGFAALALALGVIGIYGVLSYLVSTRTKEIGIRLALGAQRRDVFRSIMTEGVRLALAGIAAGVAAATVATRMLAQELYGVGPADPATYVVVSAVMLVVTMAACALPTYRATRVDPLRALREN